MLSQIKKLWQNRNFRIVITVFLAAKILALATGYTAYFSIDPSVSSRMYVTDSPYLNPWAQFDGRAYLDIAKNGYNDEFNNAGNYGWFPLYPLMIKIFSFMGADLAAFLIPNIFSLLSVVMFYILVKEEFGEKVTKKAVFYLSLFPTAYFFSVMYTESIFLFLTLVTFYYSRKEKWAYAGIAGFLAALTRLQGIILFLPLAYMYMEKCRFDIKKIKMDALLLLLVPLGTLTFFAYMAAVTGDPLTPLHGLAANQKEFAPPWVTLITGHEGLMNIAGSFVGGACFTNIVARADCVYRTFNFAIAIIFSALALLSFKFLKKDYAIYFLASMAIVLFSNTLQGVSRFVLVVFPAFVMLPLLENKYPRFSMLIKVVYILSIIMLIALTTRHVNMHLDIYGL